MNLHVSTGKYKNTILKVPKSAKPIKNIVKQSMFNYLDNLNIITNANVLDLYSGSGNLGIEAISRGATNCVMIDNDSEAIKCMVENIEKLNLSTNAEAINMDSLKYVGASTPDYDLIFADPPYSDPTKHLLKTVHYALKDGGVFVYAHSKQNNDLEGEGIVKVTTRCFGKSCFTVYKADSK